MSHHRPMWVHVTSPPASQNASQTSFRSPTASRSLVSPRGNGYPSQVIEVVDARDARLDARDARDARLAAQAAQTAHTQASHVHTVSGPSGAVYNSHPAVKPHIHAAARVLNTAR